MKNKCPWSIKISHLLFSGYGTNVQTIFWRTYLGLKLQCTKAVHTETKLLGDDFDANENKQLEDLPQSDFPVYLKDFFYREGPIH